MQKMTLRLAAFMKDMLYTACDLVEACVKMSPSFKWVGSEKQVN